MSGDQRNIIVISAQEITREKEDWLSIYYDRILNELADALVGIRGRERDNRRIRCRVR